MTDEEVREVVKIAMKEISVPEVLETLVGEDLLKIVDLLPLDWLRKRLEETDKEMEWELWFTFAE